MADCSRSTGLLAVCGSVSLPPTFLYLSRPAGLADYDPEQVLFPLVCFQHPDVFSAMFGPWSVMFYLESLRDLCFKINQIYDVRLRSSHAQRRLTAFL